MRTDNEFHIAIRRGRRIVNGYLVRVTGRGVGKYHTPVTFWSRKLDNAMRRARRWCDREAKLTTWTKETYTP